MSMFGPKAGWVSVRSETDPRWNKDWRVAWLVTGGQHPEAQKWVDEKTKELGPPPADLTYSFFKD